MQNRNWLTSDFQQRRLFASLRRHSKRRTYQRLVLLACVVTLMVFVPLLSGCHTLPTPPCEQQPLPMKPALSEPLPSESYSMQAQKNIQTWQKKLDATPTTSRP